MRNLNLLLGSLALLSLEMEAGCKKADAQAAGARGTTPGAAQSGTPGATLGNTNPGASPGATPGLTPGVPPQTGARTGGSTSSVTPGAQGANPSGRATAGNQPAIRQ